MVNGRRRSQHMRPILIRNPRGFPTSSWWTACAIRDEFSRVAASGRNRMSWSRFGRRLLND